MLCDEVTRCHDRAVQLGIEQNRVGRHVEHGGRQLPGAGGGADDRDPGLCVQCLGEALAVQRDARGDDESDRVVLDAISGRSREPCRSPVHQ